MEPTPLQAWGHGVRQDSGQGMELRDPHLFILLAPELAGTAVTQFEELLTLLSSCFQPSDREGRREWGAKASGPSPPPRLLW